MSLPDGVDMSGHEMPAEAVADAQRTLEVHARCRAAARQGSCG